jgi:hypothetical protein
LAWFAILEASRFAGSAETGWLAVRTAFTDLGAEGTWASNWSTGGAHVATWPAVERLPAAIVLQHPALETGLLTRCTNTAAALIGHAAAAAGVRGSAVAAEQRYIRATVVDRSTVRIDIGAGNRLTALLGAQKKPSALIGNSATFPGKAGVPAAATDR